MDTSVNRLAEIHSRRTRIATYWHNKAFELHTAAGALYYCMDAKHSADATVALGLNRGPAATMPVYRMLCGMALELAYKAVVVSLGKTPPRTHHLLDLAKRAGVELTAQEKSVLGLLTECIYWDGRYPVPIEPESMDKLDELARKALFRADHHLSVPILKPIRPSPLDWEQFQALWLKSWAKYVPSRE